MSAIAAKVLITERQQDVLQSWVQSRGSAQGLPHRAEIILLAFDGFTNQVIAEKLHCERHGVGIWRKTVAKSVPSFDSHRIHGETAGLAGCH